MEDTNTAVIDPQPATTPTTDSAAPATSAPVVTPPASETRPSSFKEAFERVEAEKSKPAADPVAPTTSAPAAVTTPGTVTPSPADTPGPKLADHQRILENTREKTRLEVTAAFERDYGWAKGVNREAFQDIRNVATRMSTDAIGFYKWFGEQLAQHPVHGPAFQAMQRQAPTANAEPEPDVQIVNERGEAVGMTYSAKQLAARDTYREQRLEARFGQQIAPLREAHESAQKAEEARQLSAANHATADKVLERIDKVLDGRKDLWPKVDELMAADPTLDAIDAALQVKQSILVPSQHVAAAAQAAADMKRKANGNTANGASAASVPAKRPSNPKELAAFMRQLDAAS